MPNTLYDALIAPRRGADAPFLQLPDGGTTSYREFADHAARLASALAARGVKPGDRVAAQVPKTPAALALYIGCVQAGAVFLPLNTAYTASEVEYFIGDAEPTLLVCDPGRRAELEPIAATHAALLLDLDRHGAGSLAAAADAAAPDFAPVSRGPDDLAAILYTSGTTGRSKGAMLSHRNLLSNALALASAWRFEAHDVLLHALPIFHTHGLFVATNVTLAAGSSAVFLPGFDRDAMIAQLPHASVLMGVPTFYTRLLEDPRFTRELVAHMRLFVSGSAPLLAETHRAFEERTGHRILERYGMTETNMNTSNPYEGERRAGTVGPPLPGVEVRVRRAEDGAPLPDGEVGVIEVRGPNVFSGYWRMPEKTREEFRADGFFVTGDLGRIDADGYVHIVGRAKDLIISGGYNIYPKEVELLLDEQEGVLESAVIGVPDADFGEAVIAVVVARPGVELDADALNGAIAGKLARFKRPRSIHLVPELPRNTMGKVQKNLLRDRFGGSRPARAPT